MKTKSISVNEVEYTASSLAVKFMTWNEPIPHFGSRYPNVLESCLKVPFQTLLAHNVFYTYWACLYTAVFASHLLFRFARPVWLFKRHGFAIEKIVRENYSTVSVYITGSQLDKFRINPGQFMIFRFLVKGMWWQAHPFSLSFVPNGSQLRITVKELGDFTRKVAGLAVGTKIIIDGPYGVFTDMFSLMPKTLFIAGGIGITPVRSLMEALISMLKRLGVPSAQLHYEKFAL